MIGRYVFRWKHVGKWIVHPKNPSFYFYGHQCGSWNLGYNQVDDVSSATTGNMSSNAYFKKIGVDTKQEKNLPYVPRPPRLTPIGFFFVIFLISLFGVGIS